MTGSDNFSFKVSDGLAETEWKLVDLTIQDTVLCENCRIEFGQSHLLGSEGKKTFTKNDRGDALNARDQLTLRLVAKRKTLLLVEADNDMTGAPVNILDKDSSPIGAVDLRSPATPSSCRTGTGLLHDHGLLGNASG